MLNSSKLDFTPETASPEETNDKTTKKDTIKNFNFYDLDSEDPLKTRITLLRKQNPKFSSLKEDQLVQLIGEYDSNCIKPHV